jgi:hypothetical protein
VHLRPECQVSFDEGATTNLPRANIEMIEG